MEKESLNSSIRNKIVTASELLLKREYNNNIMVADAFIALQEIVDNENLNHVSDIYIYEEGFGTLNTELKNTLVHAITSVIAFKYSGDNLEYLEGLALSDDTKWGDVAFDYLLKIGAYHTVFKDRVLAFVKKNTDVFSKNKLNTAAFYLASVYKKESETVELLKTVITIHTEKYKSDIDKDNMKKPCSETDEIEVEAKPWWKFW